MGLAEKRKMKELQETVLPGRVQEIAEICGAPIPYEIEWDTLAEDMAGLNFLDNLSCHRLNMALRVICSDDMGKEAIRESLRMVRLRNVKDPSEMKIVFDGGVLEMHCAYARGTEGMFSDGVIRQTLEKGV
jgi:hypothetical protein